MFGNALDVQMLKHTTAGRVAKDDRPTHRGRFRARTLTSPLALALEPRFMFDAAGVATGADAAVDAAAQEAADQQTDNPTTGDNADPLAAALQTSAPPADRQEVVFVDPNIDGIDVLLQGIHPAAEVVVLDPTGDGLSQIADYLSEQSDVDAVHVISHGQAGAVVLGGLTLDLAVVDARSDDLATIGDALTAEADILIYGCDVAAGAAGEAFVAALAEATGADVAASTDDTGAAAQGADWDLETEHGTVEATVIVDAAARAAFQGPLAVTIDASQTVQVTGDTDGDGEADPGETVTFETIITNNGTDDANTVVLHQVLDGMIFVDGSINVSPLAFDDTYQAIGNVGLTVDAANGVRANDLEFTGAGFDPRYDAIADTTIALDTGPANGTLTLDADGGFTYNPNVGFSGTDTFVYTITDNAGLMTTGTVSINVQNVIWFIDDTAGSAAPGTGTQADPFTSLGAFNAAVTAGGATAPGDGDIIYLDGGDDGTYNGGIALLDNQILIGEGAGASIAAITGLTVPTGITLPTTGGAAPEITNIGVGGIANGIGVDLASGNTVRGLTIGNTTGAGLSDGEGASGGSVGNLTVAEVSITGTGQAVDIDQGGTLAVTLDSVASTGSAAEGIDLAGLTGSFAVTGQTTLNTGANTALSYTGNLAGFTATFASVDIDTTGGTGILATGNGTLNITTGTVDATTGRAIDINGPTVNATLTDLNVTNGANGGVSIQNSAGAKAFSDVNITTAAGVGFLASSAGTVTVTGAGNTVSSTNAAAIDIRNTTIGTVGGGPGYNATTGSFGGTFGITFQSISSSGGTNGIVLDTVGNSGFAVTGTGATDGSGGIISNTDQAVLAATLANLSLANMNLNTTTGNSLAKGAINLTAVTNVRLDNVTINDSNSHGILATTVTNFSLVGSEIIAAGDGQDEHGIKFANLFGTNFITNSRLDGLGNHMEDGIELINTSGIGTLTILNTFIEDNATATTSTAFGENGILVRAQGSAQLTLNVTNSTIQNMSGDAINAGADGAAGGGTLTLNVSGSTLQNVVRGISLATANGQNANFSITGNTVIQGVVATPIIIVGNQTGTVRGTIDDVTIVGSEATGARGIGNILTVDSRSIEITADDDANVIVGVSNVNASQSAGGLRLLARDRASLDATVENNTVGITIGAAEFEEAINITANDSANICLNISGNDARGNVFFDELRVRDNSSGTFQIQGYGGAAGNASQIAGFLNTQNPLITVANIDVSQPNGPITGGTCATPLTAAAGPGAGGVPALTQAQLDSVVAEAKARWEATGLTVFEQAMLDAATFTVADLDAAALGVALATQVSIDIDAAGHGWFVDATPADDAEFDRANAPSEAEATGGAAAGGIDLLTAVMHELGHVIGRDHAAAPDLMAETLDTGIRRVPVVTQLLTAAEPPVTADPPPVPAPTTGEPEPTPAEPAIDMPADNVDDRALSQVELDAIVAAALARWADTGLDPMQIAALEALTIEVVDLDGLTLGAATGSLIQIDADAAGFGWFVDATPMDDAEFATTLADTHLLAGDGAAAEGIDLLTTILHEMGHRLGLVDLSPLLASDNLMAGILGVGERRLPASGQADGAVVGSVAHTALLGAANPITIGTLPAGKSVTITWDAVIGEQTDGLIVNPSNQGVVSGGNFADVPTNTTVTTLDSLTLGGTVFNDANGNGTFEAGEGVNGVAVTLYVDTNNNGVFDPGTDAQIATGTTGANGDYSFAGLAPGDYIVQVDQSNLDAGGALAAAPFSVAGGSDPDDNVDGDDNGIPLAGQGVVSQAITLAYNQEPTAGTGNDTNTTLDFGFTDNIPPVIGNLDGDSFTFTEGDDATDIDLGGDATVTDADSADFDGGSLAVTYQSGQQAEDRLIIDTTGAVALSAGLTAGSTVSVGGVDIGTIQAGSTGGAGEGLVVNLNANATPALVQTLLRDIQYNNAGGDNPTDGNRVLRVTVTDGDGGTSNTSDVTVNVDPVNDPPVLTGLPASITVLEDTTTPLGLPGNIVSDPDTGMIKMAIRAGTGTVSGIIGGNPFSVPAFEFTGTLTQVNAVLATLQYTGAADATEPDTLIFTADDGSGGTVTQMVNVEITPINDEPAGTDATITINEDTPRAFSAADFGFTDPSDTPANSLLNVIITTLPASGTLTFGGAAVTAGQAIPAGQLGDLVYTPAANVNGATVASFDFQVQDDGGTANAGQDTDQTPNTITIDITPVNDAPAGADITITIVEDTPQALSAADFGFTDANDTPANALSAVIITTLPTSGSLTLGGVAVTAGQSIPVGQLGGLVYTPGADVDGVGAASFTFQVQDDGGTANGGVDIDPTPNTVTYDITPVNDAPGIAGAPGELEVVGGSTTTITSLSISDVDTVTSPGGIYTVTLTVDDGTLAVAAVPGLTVAGSGTGALTLSGTLAAVNAALAGGIAFTAPLVFDATDVTFTVAVTDNGNAGAGTALGDTLAFQIEVQDDPDPTILDDAGDDGGDDGPEDGLQQGNGRFLDLDNLGGAPEISAQSLTGEPLAGDLPGTGSGELGTPELFGIPVSELALGLPAGTELSGFANAAELLASLEPAAGQDPVPVEAVELELFGFPVGELALYLVGAFELSTLEGREDVLAVVAASTDGGTVTERFAVLQMLERLGLFADGSITLGDLRGEIDLFGRTLGEMVAALDGVDLDGIDSLSELQAALGIPGVVEVPAASPATGVAMGAPAFTDQIALAFNAFDRDAAALGTALSRTVR